MQTLKISLLVFILSITISAQWYEVSSNLPSGWSAWKIDAIDSLTAIGPQNTNFIYLTTNGGISWNPISRPSIVDDVEMIDTQKIWFCNGDGEIYGTSDGGINWQLQFYDTSLTEFINYIEMFDASNGIAMGDAKDNSKPAIFLKTTDGGNNWISMNQNYLIGLLSGDQWRRVDFVNINSGYFYSSGESPQKLYKTTNSGQDWIAINDTLSCTVLKFYDENNGIVISFDYSGNELIPVIYKTTDGGISWNHITIATVHWAWGTAIEFSPTNPSKVWVTTQHTVFSSTDYGITWAEQAYAENVKFLDMVFTEEDNGWLIGWDYPPTQLDYIYRTTNGGTGGIVSVDDKYGDVIVSDFALKQNYPNPFNPVTKIKYSIPQDVSRETVNVSLKIYDVLGREVATLINGEKLAGEYEVEFSAKGGSASGGDAYNLPSGIYFYQLKTGQYSETKKMILLK